jgi:hypothetical protein
MLLDEIKSVLSFAAFKADPDDSAVPWGKRFETASLFSSTSAAAP